MWPPSLVATAFGCRFVRPGSIPREPGFYLCVCVGVSPISVRRTVVGIRTSLDTASGLVLGSGTGDLGKRTKATRKLLET